MHPGVFAEEDPDRPAVIADGGQVLSYRELADRSAALARAFRAAGLEAEDGVAFRLPNGVDFFVAAWAAQRAGLYFTPMSIHLKPAEVDYILADSGAQVFLTTASLAGGPTAPGVIAGNAPPAPRRWVFGTPPGDPWVPVDRVVDAVPASVEVPDIEGADMLYTSGTTGRPKGVRAPISLAPLGSDRRRVDRMRELFLLDQGDVFLTPAPLYHAAPLRFSLTVHRLGGTVVVMDRFDPARALALIEAHRVTHSQWVPTMFVRMLRLPEDVRRAHDLSSHRVAIHSGAPITPAVKRAMIDWWGPILHEYYAGTESLGLVHCTSAEWLDHPGTVGRPWRCTIHIVGDDGEELPVGETGTVYFESPRTLRYHNAPEKTRAALHPKGWATMGDVGRVDEDGFLYLTDRKAFTIITGGVNVYPRETEVVLLDHPAVAEAAVFGVPDDEFGERVVAVVELHEPQDGTSRLADELVAFCRSRLAHLKCPRELAFAHPIPRTSTGKVAKQALREDWRAGRLPVVPPSSPSSSSSSMPRARGPGDPTPAPVPPSTEGPAAGRAFDGRASDAEGETASS